MFDLILQAVDPATVAARVVAYLPRLVSALLLALLFWVLLFVSRRLIGAALRREGVPAGATGLLVRLINYALVSIAALTIVAQLGVNVASLVAGLGIAGLAVSFAAQDTVANLISGITLAIDRPFKEGDWIALGQTHATVSEMRLRTTVLTTFDNETLVVPNKTLAQERILNYTLTPRARARVSVGIAYKESIPAARQVLLSLVTDDARVLAEPQPIVIVTGLNSSSVDLELRFWSQDPLSKFPLQWEYTEKAKLALDAAGIQIPYPHLQLFVEDTAAWRQLRGPVEDTGATA